MKYRCLSDWVHLFRKEIILMISFGYWMKICMRIRKNTTENMRNAIAENWTDKKKIVVHKSCCILPFGLYAAAYFMKKSNLIFLQVILEIMNHSFKHTHLCGQFLNVIDINCHIGIGFLCGSRIFFCNCCKGL